MKYDKLEISTLKFGILCNFTPICGEERAKELVEIVRELERLATEYQSPETQRLIELGKAVEKAIQSKNVDFDLNDDDGNYLGSFDSELLLQWYREQEAK